MLKIIERFVQRVCYAWKELKKKSKTAFDVIRKTNTLWSFGIKMYRFFKNLFNYLVTLYPIVVVQYSELKKVFWLLYNR